MAPADVRLEQLSKLRVLEIFDSAKLAAKIPVETVEPLTVVMQGGPKPLDGANREFEWRHPTCQHVIAGAVDHLKDCNNSGEPLKESGSGVRKVRKLFKKSDHFFEDVDLLLIIDPPS